MLNNMDGYHFISYFKYMVLWKNKLNMSWVVTERLDN